MTAAVKAPFVSEKLIRFHHCDPAGIVLHPQYFVLFRELAEDWFNRGLGLDYADFASKERRRLPIAHIDCDFRVPSKIGDTVGTCGRRAARHGQAGAGADLTRGRHRVSDPAESREAICQVQWEDCDQLKQEGAAITS